MTPHQSAATPVQPRAKVTFCVQGVLSPILANVYLHYVYDLLTHRWRRKATGDVIVIRYADDTIVGLAFMAMRFKLPPGGDVPPVTAARRMRLSLDAFREALPELSSPGFPHPDTTPANF